MSDGELEAKDPTESRRVSSNTSTNFLSALCGLNDIAIRYAMNLNMQQPCSGTTTTFAMPCLRVVF